MKLSTAGKFWTAYMLGITALVGSCVSQPSHAQDVEGVTQADRICIGRLMIVRQMDQYRIEGLTIGDAMKRMEFGALTPAQAREIMPVFEFVWSHESDENELYGVGHMERCYKAMGGKA